MLLVIYLNYNTDNIRYRLYDLKDMNKFHLIFISRLKITKSLKIIFLKIKFIFN